MNERYLVAAAAAAAAASIARAKATTMQQPNEPVFCKPRADAANSVQLICHGDGDEKKDVYIMQDAGTHASSIGAEGNGLA
jgi:hypothetical protein